MPKITLSFNLPEEEDDFQFAKQGSLYFCLIHDLDNELRAKLKYDDQLPETKAEIYEEIRSKIRELAERYGIEV